MIGVFLFMVIFILKNIIMKNLLLISEEERKNILNFYYIKEQRSDFAMDRQGNALANTIGVRSDSDYKKVNRIIKTAEDEAKYVVKDPHTLLLITQIATAFIPVVGVFISAGIGFADAALYYNEGDKKTAGMTAMFSVLPLLGTVVSKIPAINKLGQKGMKALSTKLAKKGSNAKLTANELEVVNGISKENSLITQELNQYSKNITNNASNKVTNNKTKKVLKNIAKSGLKFAGITGAYMGAGLTYSAAYDKYNNTSTIDLNTPPPESAKKVAAGIQW
jgi:hypothetical protein